MYVIKYIINIIITTDYVESWPSVLTRALKYKSSSISFLKMLLESSHMIPELFFMILSCRFLQTPFPHMYTLISLTRPTFVCGKWTEGKVAENAEETLSSLCKMQKESEYASIITRVQTVYFSTWDTFYS